MHCDIIDNDFIKAPAVQVQWAKPNPIEFWNSGAEVEFGQLEAGVGDKKSRTQQFSKTL